MNSHAVPKISIVLPTYNGSRWLRESVESILAQTETNWELIIVNDGSTDATPDIAESLAEKDKRISILSHETNKKLPASLNSGFASARGEYLTWTSDDNLYRPHALARMAEYLDSRPDTDLVSFNMDYIREDGTFLFELQSDARGSTAKFHVRHPALLCVNCNIGAAFMYRKSIAERIGAYDETMFCSEDYDYWCRMALSGNIGYANENIYRYRLHDASLTATRKKQIGEATQRIQDKYSEAFFEKYNFNHLDRMKTYCATRRHVPLKYCLAPVIFLVHKHLVKLLTLPLFWSWDRRHKVRKAMEFEWSFAKARES